MGSFVQEFIKGRKTFFVAPDQSLFPASFLEEYLAHGYECYFIDSDGPLSLPQKADVLLSVFKDSIIFFNVDIPLQSTSWGIVIRALKNKYPNTCVGVLYAKKQDMEEKLRLERYYLMDIGIAGGALQLEFQKRNNFVLIERMLYSNQAQGRRKQVRALCNGSCTVKLPVKPEVLIQKKLVDISLSHFSIILDLQEEIYFKEITKISGAMFLIKGLHFTSDVISVMTRDTPDGKLCIFAFTSDNGKPELNPINNQLLTPKLYSIMQENFTNLTTMLFQKQQERRDEAGVGGDEL